MWASPLFLSVPSLVFRVSPGFDRFRQPPFTARQPVEIVKGCMVIKANGYAVWEMPQRELDARLKATGHRKVYFPMLIRRVSCGVLDDR
jgi:hypothetical protein